MLLNAIQSNSSSGQLYNLLMNYSPLSDQVLLSVVQTERVKPLSQGNFKNVIMVNSPVSDSVRNELEAKLQNFPLGLKSQIQQAQLLSGFSTLTSIRRIINQLETQKESLLGDYIPYLLDQDSVSKALGILNSENTVTADQAVLGTLISEEMLQQASEKIGQMQNNSMLDDWLDLNAMLVHFRLDSNTVFEMDTMQELKVRAWAEDETKPLLASNAQAILRLVYGEEFPTTTITGTKSSIFGQADEDNVSIPDEEFLGANYPNPFSQSTVIPYYMPEESNNGLINIYDCNGKLLKQFTLEKGHNEIELNMQSFPSGLYFYYICLDGTIQQYKKMVLVHNQ